MTIPQVLGYARIAGMPSVTGLYTVLLPLMAFGVFGSSKHLVVAADSATAAIFSSALSEIAPLGSPYYQDLVGMVALLSALFLLMARFFKLGFLADFLSRTVLVGFMAGVGVQVACAMLVDMLGLGISSRNTVVQIWSLLQLLPHAVPLTAACAFGASLFLWAAERLNKAVPWALLVVVCGIVCGWALPLQAHGVSLVGPMAGGLPKLHLPHVAWNDLLALLPVATSCVFVIIAQSAATARAAANMFNETVDENRDILGLSVANLAAAVSGTFVVNGSPTQTAMALKAGARSQLAQGIFSVLTLCVLLFFTAPLRYLPHCILAAIVFNVGVGMVNVGALNRIRRESPGEFWLALITGAIVLGLGVEQGIFAAIALSL
ncbi:MAG: SulP family inorganic anion transporter, partial [Acetobacter orientalis]